MLGNAESKSLQASFQINRETLLELRSAVRSNAFPVTTMDPQFAESKSCSLTAPNLAPILLPKVSTFLMDHSLSLLQVTYWSLASTLTRPSWHSPLEIYLEHWFRALNPLQCSLEMWEHGPAMSRSPEIISSSRWVIKFYYHHGVFSRMAKLLGWMLVLHQIWLNMEGHARVSIIASGWGSVNLSHYTHHPPKLGYSSREGRSVSLSAIEWSWPIIILWLAPPFVYHDDPSPC